MAMRITWLAALLAMGCGVSGSDSGGGGGGDGSYNGGNGSNCGRPLDLTRLTVGGTDLLGGDGLVESDAAPTIELRFSSPLRADVDHPKPVELLVGRIEGGDVSGAEMVSLQVRSSDPDGFVIDIVAIEEGYHTLILRNEFEDEEGCRLADYARREFGFDYRRTGGGGGGTMDGCVDLDHDGYGPGCGPGPDCDDGDGEINPGLGEEPFNGRDDDCDPGTLDNDGDGDGVAQGDDCNDSDPAVWQAHFGYVDGDGDGYGVGFQEQECVPPGQQMLADTDADCDDGDPARYRWADVYSDGDSDGFGIGEVVPVCIGAAPGPPYALVDGDCFDDNAAVNPGADETPYDGLDNDCDAATPDDDIDGDGALVALDCDDDDPARFPGNADPTADGTDQNCDGVDGPADSDGDGFTSVASGGDDCDDGDPDVNPGELETPYNGIDDDCDPGSFDDDVDGDGALLATDCDDDDSTRYPGNMDTSVDGKDQNCDDVDGPADVDRDGDNAADTGGTDCDDTDPFTHVGGHELADDGVDNDCSGGDLRAVDGVGIYVRPGSGCSNSTTPANSFSVPYCDPRLAFQDAVGGEDIFVSGGDFAAVRGWNAQQVYGGYSPGSWSTRDIAAHRTRFAATAVSHGYSELDGNATLLDGLTLVGDMQTASNGLSSGVAHTGSLVVIRCDIDGGGGDGVSIGIRSEGALYVRDSIIDGGTSPSGPSRGISNSVGSDITVMNSAISGGSAFGSAQDSHGLIVIGAGDLSLYNTLVTGGYSATGRSSGALFGGTVELLGCQIDGGTAAGGDTRGISLLQFATASLINNDIDGGSASGTSIGVTPTIDTSVRMLNNNVFGAAQTSLLVAGPNITTATALNQCAWVGCVTATGNLSSGDPADLVDAGLTVDPATLPPGASHDRDGAPRPQGGGWDIGPIEN